MTEIDLVQSLQSLGLAALLGAAVGLERGHAGKPAGLRTHMLVSATSALFVVLGYSIVENLHDQAESIVRADPIRILQAIVLGISFLGTGTIIQDRHGEVEGLTTAASLMMTSSLGVAVALGHELLAIAVTAALVVLVPTLGLLETRCAGWFPRKGEDPE